MDPLALALGGGGGGGGGGSSSSMGASSSKNDRHRVAAEEKRKREEARLQREAELENERQLKRQRREKEARAKRDVEQQKKRAVEAEMRSIEKSLAEATSAKLETTKKMKECRQNMLSLKKELSRMQNTKYNRDAEIETRPLRFEMVPAFPGMHPGPVLFVWGVATSFSKTLGLAKFGADMLVRALQSDKDSVLLVETARRLLKHATFTTPDASNWEEILLASWDSLKAEAAADDDSLVDPVSPFSSSLDANAKASVLQVVALCALRSFRGEVDARKEGQARAVAARKDDVREGKAKQRDEMVKLREEAVRAIKKERERAKLARDWDDDDDDQAAAPAAEEEEPSTAEVSRRVEQLKDSQVCEGRNIVDDPLPLDEVSEDEEEEGRDPGRPARNAERKARRLKKSQIEEARVECEAWFRRNRANATASQLRAWLREARACQLSGGGRGDDENYEDDDDENSSSAGAWCTKTVAAAMRQAHKLEKLADDEDETRRYRETIASFDVRREPVGTDRHGRRYWWLDDAKVPGHPRPKMPRIFVQQDDRWFCVSTKSKISGLCDALDEDHSTERLLKEKLVDLFLSSDEDYESRQKLWRTDLGGPGRLGEICVRRIQRTTVEGVVAGWLSAEENEGQALWHVEHSDGDEEDLEAHELDQARLDFESAYRRYVNVPKVAGGQASDYYTTPNGIHVQTITQNLIDFGYTPDQIDDIVDFSGVFKTPPVAATVPE